MQFSMVTDAVTVRKPPPVVPAAFLEMLQNFILRLLPDITLMPPAYLFATFPVTEQLVIVVEPDTIEMPPPR